MHIILISYPEFFKGESKIVSSLLVAYDFIFHLRKPEADLADYDTFMQDIPEKYHNKIVLHNAYALQDKYHIKGIHFPVKNRKNADQFQPSGSKSTSCHSLKELKMLDGLYDYVFLSPIFPSISKKDYVGDLNLTEVGTYLNRTHQTKVIALGGIDISRIKQLKNYMFDGFALLGAVWTSKPGNGNTVNNNFKEIYQWIQQDHIA